MKKEKGSYVLLAELAASKDIFVGKLGCIRFPKAFYAYVGSAMNGLEARVAHHLRDNKKPHWHIDYLLKDAKVSEMILCPSESFALQGKLPVECFLAQALAAEFQSVAGFGASDCKCKSHLYFGDKKDELTMEVIGAIEQAGLSYKTFLPKERQNDTRVW
jgi:Uri superfamily endonuclease